MNDKCVLLIVVFTNLRCVAYRNKEIVHRITSVILQKCMRELQAMVLRSTVHGELTETCRKRQNSLSALLARVVLSYLGLYTYHKIHLHIELMN